MKRVTHNSTFGGPSSPFLPQPGLSTTAFTKLNNKTLSASKTQKNFLVPIKGKHKYDNAVLFELREINNMKEKAKKDSYSTINAKYSKKTLQNLNKNFYLTESPSVIDKSSARETDGVHSTGPSTNFLKEITEERNKDREKLLVKEQNHQLLKKNNVLNVQRNNSVRNFINKTREIVLMKYTTDIKKERAIRLQETYNNEIESIKDTIKSMEEARKLFNDNFLTKFSEYVKHLTLQREEEKAIDSGYMDRIIKLKNEIIALENRKKKIESDKANLGRWMYFQIQIKEKKLNLPFYYSLILDNKTHSDLDLEANLLKVGNNLSILKNVSKEEKERILQYKNNLIFKTASDFLDEFTKYENKNIMLIERYNTLSEELNEIKKEKEILVNEEIRENEIITNELLNKEKKLQIVKKKYESLQKDKSSMLAHNTLKILSDREKNKGKKNRAPSADGYRGLRGKLNHTKLYSKILEVFQNIKKNDEDKKIQIKKIVNSSEIEMLNMLSKIELALDILIRQNQAYLNGPRAPELKEIQIQIEKEHKIKKTLMQREAQLRKIEYLKDKIEERNNKIYFLPLRKIEKNYAFRAKKEKQRKIKNRANSIPIFDDFMYDLFE